MDNGQIDKTDQHMNHGQTDKKVTQINNEQQTKHKHEHKNIQMKNGQPKKDMQTNRQSIHTD